MSTLSEATDDINISMASDDVVIHCPLISMYIKNVVGKGRGVYAGESISSRTLINISPVLLFPESDEENSTQSKESQYPERDILAHYTYTFGNNTQALALGMGSMFNHSKKNNVGFVIDKQNLLIRYTTVKDIDKDDELCINYGYRLWFEDEDDDGKGDSDTDSDDLDNPFGRMEL
jgi:SET domain-containing protein